MPRLRRAPLEALRQEQQRIFWHKRWMRKDTSRSDFRADRCRFILVTSAARAYRCRTDGLHSAGSDHRRSGKVRRRKAHAFTVTQRMPAQHAASCKRIWEHAKNARPEQLEQLVDYVQFPPKVLCSTSGLCGMPRWQVQSELLNTSGMTAEQSSGSLCMYGVCRMVCRSNRRLVISTL